MGPIAHPAEQWINEVSGKETRDYGIMTLFPNPFILKGIHMKEELGYFCPLWAPKDRTWINEWKLLGGSFGFHNEEKLSDR